MSGQLFLLPTDDAGVACVVIRNPGKLNALSVAMWHALRAIFDGLRAAADTPRVLLLYGEGLAALVEKRSARF